MKDAGRPPRPSLLLPSAVGLGCLSCRDFKCTPLPPSPGSWLLSCDCSPPPPADVQSLPNTIELGPSHTHIRLNMKRTYPLFALGSVLSGVEASRRSNNKRDVDWRPAQVTVAVDQLLHGTSPKPTNAPRAPDPAPERSLDKRANYDNTCAYVSGIKGTLLFLISPPLISNGLPQSVVNSGQPHPYTATLTMPASTTASSRSLDAVLMLH